MLQQQLEDAQQTQTVLRAATRRSARSTTREEEGEEREKGATEGRRGSRARCCRMMMTTMAKMMIQARRRGIGRRDVVSSRHATAIERKKGRLVSVEQRLVSFGFGLRYYVRVVKYSVKYFILTLNTIYNDGQALSWAICSDCGKLAHGILLAKKMLRRWVRADAYVRFSEARSSFPAHAPLFKFHIW